MPDKPQTEVAIPVQIDEIAGLTEGIPARAWVAISEKLDKVLAYGIDLPTVVDEARDLGEDLPQIVRIPEPVAMFL